MKNNLETISVTMQNVANLVASYINRNFVDFERKIIFTEVNNILGFEIEKYSIEDADLAYEHLQKKLSAINEKGTNRKTKGVYYTPHDLVRFIIVNLAKISCGKLRANNLHVLDLNGIPYSSFCYKKNIFDPTCGTGEFLLVSLDIKLDLLELHHGNITAGKIKKVVRTISGNDIDPESIAISKIRLLLIVLDRFGARKITGLSSILNRNFTTIDYIESPEEISVFFDIIVGNPPYVENSKCQSNPLVNYGNVYANVLENSSKQLNRSGVMGYVIPLSYVSTLRMKKIRDVICRQFNEQFILSYSDRPDCLFTSVHQKLCVLIARNSGKQKCYTGNYQYWYKGERERLFEETSAIENKFINSNFIPKIGNKNDSDIFEKVYSTKNTILENLSDTGSKIFLNMRATFWIKAFLSEHLGSEYKVLKFDEDLHYFMMCLFNSSLFWWYWVCVSDCWHITHKELNSFRLPSQFDPNKAKLLALKLEEKLEKTKIYVGTKQTEYEYKHKACLDIIHEIDDFISIVFGLSSEENMYIKNFNLRYRIGGGAIK